MFSMRKKDGYTLMELLTVIAIIGVLAGLIFPVAASAKRRARQAQCINNMYQIFTALKQFQLDEHRYPEFIAGPVQFKNGTTFSYTGTDIVPLENNTGMMITPTGTANGRPIALYPEYISNFRTLQCPFTDLNGDDNRKYGTGLKPDGTSEPLDIVDDPMFTVAVRTAFRTSGTGTSGTGMNMKAFSLYKCSSYDYEKPPGFNSMSDPALANQAHYSLAWKWVPGNDPDLDPAITRQLKWRTPPEDTVVTWCSHHRSNDASGAPLQSSKDICLFLDGHVKQVASPDMEPFTKGWLAAP